MIRQILTGRVVVPGIAGARPSSWNTMALLFAAETARFVTDRSLQYHGGYGFSEEYDIQLHHRRASAWLLQLGEPGLEYARLAAAEFGPVGIVTKEAC